MERSAHTVGVNLAWCFSMETTRFTPAFTVIENQAICTGLCYSPFGLHYLTRGSFEGRCNYSHLTGEDTEAPTRDMTRHSHTGQKGRAEASPRFHSCPVVFVLFHLTSPRLY